MDELSFLPNSIRELLREVALIDPDAFPIPLERRPNESIIKYDMPLPVKRLFAFLMFLAKLRDQAKIDFDYATDRSEKRRIHSLLHEIEMKADLIKEIAWWTVRHDIDQLDLCKSIGVRSGWLIVNEPDEPHEAFEPPRIPGFKVIDVTQIMNEFFKKREDTDA